MVDILKVLWLLYFCALSTGNVTADEFGKATCKDDNGKHVDWYYLYKLPKNFESESIKAKRTGLQYMHATSSNYNAWQLSQHNINSTDSMPGKTLQPIFDDPNLLLIAYNDEFPNGTVIKTGGHTKGVFATDGLTAIWLIHSVPKYPNTITYEYPSTGQLYGQSFLCLSLKVEEVEKVATQLIYNEPNIYYARVPAALREKFPTLNRALSGERREAPPYYNQVILQTVGKDEFKSFAKSHRLNLEFYEDLLAPTLDIDLLVESWRKGSGNMYSNCTRSDKVYNVEKIGETSLDISFESTEDHSKWAVSKAAGFKLWRWRLFGSDWICVGDLNRQQHQLKRGGGSVCLKNSKASELYRNMITNYERC